MNQDRKPVSHWEGEQLTLNALPLRSKHDGTT